MKYKELKGICKEAIEKEWCLGCVGLVENDWKEPEQCLYISKKEHNQLSIEQLRIGGKMC